MDVQETNEKLKKAEQQGGFVNRWPGQLMSPTPQGNPAWFPWFVHALLGLAALLGFWGIGFILSMALAAVHVTGLLLAAYDKTAASWLLLVALAAAIVWWPQ